MTQFQHNIIAAIVVMIMWHGFLKRYFYGKDEYQLYVNFWKKLFFGGR